MNDFKRRMIAISLSTMMAISTISAMSIYADDAEPTTPKLESGRLLGDVNKDGKISTADVGLANSHAKASKILVDEDFEAADVNNDKKITTADVGLINSHVKGVRLLDGSTPSPTDPSDTTDPTDVSDSTEPTNPSLEDGELDLQTGKAYLLSKYEEIKTRAQNCLDNLPSEEDAVSTIVIDNVETIVYPTLISYGYPVREDLIEGLTKEIERIDNVLIPRIDEDVEDYLVLNENEYYKGKTDVEVFDHVLELEYETFEKYRIKEDGTIPNYLDFYSVIDDSDVTFETASINHELGEKGNAWVEAIRAENLTDLEIIKRANEYAIELYEQAYGKLTEKANFDNIHFYTEIRDLLWSDGRRESSAWEFIEDPAAFIEEHTVVSLPAVVSALVEPLGIDLYCRSWAGGCDCLVYWDEETQTRYFTNVVLNAYYSSGLYGAEDINTYTNLTDPYDMSVAYCEFHSDVRNSIPKTSIGRDVKRVTSYNKGNPSPFNKFYGASTMMTIPLQQ